MAAILEEPIKIFGACLSSVNTNFSLNGSPSTLSLTLIEDPANGALFIQPAMGSFHIIDIGENFKFKGVLTKVTKNKSGSGFTFSVELSDPRELIKDIVFQLGAAFNVKSIADSVMGGANTSPIISPFSGFQRQTNFNFGGVDSFSVAGQQLAYILSGLEFTPVTLFGTKYELDFTDLKAALTDAPDQPVLSGHVAADQFISEVVEQAGVDWWTDSVIITDNDKEIIQIKIKVIDRKIDNVTVELQEFIDAHGADTVISSASGTELRNDIAGIILVGGKVQMLESVPIIGHFHERDPLSSNIPKGEYGTFEPRTGDDAAVNARFIDMSTITETFKNEKYLPTEAEMQHALKSQESWAAYVWEKIDGGIADTINNNIAIATGKVTAIDNQIKRLKDDQAKAKDSGNINEVSNIDKEISKLQSNKSAVLNNLNLTVDSINDTISYQGFSKDDVETFYKYARLIPKSPTPVSAGDYETEVKEVTKELRELIALYAKDNEKDDVTKAYEAIKSYADTHYGKDFIYSTLDGKPISSAWTFDGPDTNNKTKVNGFFGEDKDGKAEGYVKFPFTTASSGLFTLDNLDNSNFIFTNDGLYVKAEFDAGICTLADPIEKFRSLLYDEQEPFLYWEADLPKLRLIEDKIIPRMDFRHVDLTTDRPLTLKDFKGDAAVFNAVTAKGISSINEYREEQSKDFTRFFLRGAEDLATEPSRFKPIRAYIPVELDRRYGPFTSQQIGQGKLTIIEDESITPEQFGSFNFMQFAAIQKVSHGYSTITEVESASLNISGLPKFSIGDSVGINANVTGISISFAGGGITTSYTLSAFLKRSGQFPNQINREFTKINRKKIEKENDRFKQLFTGKPKLDKVQTVRDRISKDDSKQKQIPQGGGPVTNGELDSGESTGPNGIFGTPQDPAYEPGNKSFRTNEDGSTDASP